MMPSYVNIGAWVGPRTMVDTWATVGSCAQIGATSTSPAASGSAACSSRRTRAGDLEDGAFIGSRCIVTEGVRIGEGRCSGRTCR